MPILATRSALIYVFERIRRSMYFQMKSLETYFKNPWLEFRLPMYQCTFALLQVFAAKIFPVTQVNPRRSSKISNVHEMNNGPSPFLSFLICNRMLVSRMNPIKSIFELKTKTIPQWGLDLISPHKVRNILNSFQLVFWQVTVVLPRVLVMLLLRLFEIFLIFCPIKPYWEKGEKFDPNSK